MATKVDVRQLVWRAAGSMIGSAAGDTLDTILAKIDPELGKLYEDRNILLVSDGTVTFPAAGTSVTFSSNLRLHINSQIAGGTPTVIDLAATTRTLSANLKMVYAVINRTGGTATVTDDASSLPAQTSSNQEVVLIAKRVDATDGTKRVYFRNGFSLSAGQTARFGQGGTAFASEFSVVDATDTTKKIAMQASGSTTGKTLTLASAITLDRTVTFPDATTTLVGTDTSDTLSNKTLAFLKQSVATDSTTTGSNTTLAAFTTGIVRVTNASLVSLSGFPAGASGQSLILENMTGATITINNDEATATAANRIYTGSSANVTMSNQATFIFTYDTTNSRWMLTGGSGSGSGTGGINYITFGTAEAGTQGWSTYNENQTATFTNGSANIGITSGTGYVKDQRVSFTTSGTLPTNFSPNTTYYVVSVVTNTIQVSATLGGTAISAGSAGSGTHTLHPMDPIAGTGGAVSGLTFSASTSSPLRGLNSYTLVQTNSTVVQGQGVAYAFTIDNADKAKVLSIQIDYNASSTFVASNGQTGNDSDIEFYIYDVTNSVLIPVSPKVITANGSNNYTFTGEFQTANNSTSYRLIAHCVTSNANATGWTFKYDNVQTGPQTKLLGAPITDWKIYTPTLGAGWGTTTNLFGMYRRVGDSEEYIVRFTAGTTSASSSSVGLASGRTIDSAKITGVTNVGVMNVGGTNIANDGSAFQRSALATGGNGYIEMGRTETSTNLNTILTPNNIAASGFDVSVHFMVPITGSSSTTQMSNDTDTRVVAASYTNSSTSVPTATATVMVLSTSVIDTHAAYSTSTGVYTVPVSGLYKVDATAAAFAPQTPASSAARNFYLILRQNSTAKVYGPEFQSLQSTTSIHAIGVVSGLLNCKAGDTIDVQAYHELGATGSLANTVETSFAVHRLSGPAAIAASESVNARYYSSTTTINTSTNTIVWTTKDFDSHNVMSSGVYTVPISGKYLVIGSLENAATFSINNQETISIQKNGVTVSQNTIFAAATVTAINSQVQDIISCLAGDTIKITYSTQGTSPAISGSTARNYMSLTRVGN